MLLLLETHCLGLSPLHNTEHTHTGKCKGLSWEARSSGHLVCSAQLHLFKTLWRRLSKVSLACFSLHGMCWADDIWPRDRTASRVPKINIPGVLRSPMNGRSWNNDSHLNGVTPWRGKSWKGKKEFHMLYEKYLDKYYFNKQNTGDFSGFLRWWKNSP